MRAPQVGERHGQSTCEQVDGDRACAAQALLDRALKGEADDGGRRQRERQHGRPAQAVQQLATQGQNQPERRAVMQRDLEGLGVLRLKLGGGPPQKLGSSTVWAEEETGSNSVGPCISPSRRAWRNGIRGASASLACATALSFGRASMSADMLSAGFGRGLARGAAAHDEVADAYDDAGDMA